ncbi:hypothetical protein POSPLADRAFT_1046022 [Postia placenta MAD-698-R-SB12]|uniref:Uncharacterized protein n=1 Tax=Postia placenta MAD-698-R-SB12 TaxID=670580 RepID=A0A1X6N1T8_9APHY|nr:hypothetical protein POSPLADRAFT_1046022 [Postia placenta MAD-698-R-SB12]OSX62554.1 hypothetical protein POSPLADRAFT_1046022 [Postia placenta MAD-698-R-SB12]
MAGKTSCQCSPVDVVVLCFGKGRVSAPVNTVAIYPHCDNENSCGILVIEYRAQWPTFHTSTVVVLARVMIYDKQVSMYWLLPFQISVHGTEPTHIIGMKPPIVLERIGTPIAFDEERLSEHPKLECLHPSKRVVSSTTLYRGGNADGSQFDKTRPLDLKPENRKQKPGTCGISAYSQLTEIANPS